jgi:hypothetical protein
MITMSLCMGVGGGGFIYISGVKGGDGVFIVLLRIDISTVSINDFNE